MGGLRARQILLLVLLVAIIVAVSVAVEIGEVTRAAVEESRRDAEYIASALTREIQYVVARNPQIPPYQAVGEDPRIKVGLNSATRFAPTVLYAAFCDSAGRVVIHDDPTRTGSFLPRYSELPDATGFGDIWAFLLELRREGSHFYDVVTPLRMGESSFGTVRVGLSSAFIEAEVRRVVRRGVVIGIGQVALALIAAVFVTRVFVGPIRDLRRGLEALKQGDFTHRVPHQGIDEFASLAEAVNELGDRFRAVSSSDGDPLRRAVEHLADGLLVIGPDREVQHVNGIAARHLDLDGEQWRGRTLNELFPDGHPLRRLTDDILAGKGDRMQLRAELTRTNGKAGVLAVGHRIEDETDSRVLIELKDLSALAELQAVMDHSNTLSRLGEMAAGVAHEIRNPLNAITLHLEPLRSGETLDPGEVRAALDETGKQIHRLDRAVSGFLKVARLQRLALVPVQPETLVRDVVDLIQPEAVMAGLDLRFTGDPDLPRILGDPEVLRQALLNLVKNAVQAVPSRDGTVTVNCTADGGGIGITVTDTGPGIDAELLPRVFDLYVTSKDGGSGVGLAFVRQAVEMHRGTVTVDSDPGSGTRVTLWLRSEVRTEASHA